MNWTARGTISRVLNEGKVRRIFIGLFTLISMYVKERRGEEGERTKWKEVTNL
jgi:hypothetical protein